LSPLTLSLASATSIAAGLRRSNCSRKVRRPIPALSLLVIKDLSR